jgi:hypothetical protein
MNTEPKGTDIPIEAFDEDLDGDGVADVPAGFAGAVVEAPVVDAGLVELPVLIEANAVVEVETVDLTVPVEDAELVADDSDSSSSVS